MIKAKPLLTDVHPTKIKFEAGDRILARVADDLNINQHQNLVRSIKKFAEADVRVLVVNCLSTRMMLVHKGGGGKMLASHEHALQQSLDLGVANVSCSPVKFLEGDRLILCVPPSVEGLHKKQLERLLKEWAGDDVEVRIKVGNL